MKNTREDVNRLPLNNVWHRFLDWENLLSAYRKARLGKRDQAEVQAFTFNLEYELSDIRNQMLERTYEPGEFRQFHVRDRKLRLISAAPFRDRVVHHALMNVVEPALDKEFIAESFASRKHKGVHAAVRTYRRWSKRYRYALKIDVSRYFDSIDHELLKQKLAKRIADKDVIWLFDRIIDSGPKPASPNMVLLPGEDLADWAVRNRGLPLGNLTSQFLGNLYLNDLDQYIKSELKIPAYLRYVDDMVLLANDKARLWDWCEKIERFLQCERIGLHPRKKVLVPVACGLDVLGYRVFPNAIRLARGSGYNFRRKLHRLSKSYAKGKLTLQEIKPHVAGWLGHARQANSNGLCKSILSEVSFTKGGSAKRSPGGSRRFVEQQPTEPPVGEPEQEQRR